jgi:hypothetical protein
MKLKTIFQPSLSAVLVVLEMKNVLENVSYVVSNTNLGKEYMCTPLSEYFSASTPHRLLDNS